MGTDSDTSLSSSADKLRVVGVRTPREFHLLSKG